MAKGKYHDWISDDGLSLLSGFARDGLTDKEIAEKKIGVSERTFTDWKARFPAIVAALKKGKEPADYAMEESLYKSGTGFIVTLKKPIKLRRFDGSETIEYADEEVYIAPQVTAQIFWLKNRKPERWRDKPAAIQQDAEQNDGFLEALSGTAAQDWADDDE